MARARLLDRIADGDERVEAALLANRREAVKLRKKTRDLRPAPQPAVVRRRLDPLLQRRESLGRQQRRLGAVLRALVAKTVRPALVVALDQRFDPTRRHREKLCDLLDRVAKGDKPNGVKMALGDRLARRLVTRFQLLDAQMSFDPRHDPASNDES